MVEVVEVAWLIVVVPVVVAEVQLQLLLTGNGCHLKVLSPKLEVSPQGCHKEVKVKVLVHARSQQVLHTDV